MWTDRQEKLNQALEAYDLDGVSFFEAKQQLVEKGYSDDEVWIAAASAPFDGKRSQKKPANPMTETYAKNPRLAKGVAKSLLKHESEMRQARIRAAAMSTLTPFTGINPVSARGASDLSHELGFPLLRLLVPGLIGVLILLQLDIDAATVLTIAQYYILGIGSILLIFLVRSEVRNRRRTTTTGSRIPRGVFVLVVVAIVAILSIFLSTP